MSAENKVHRRGNSLTLIVLLMCGLTVSADSQEIRPGVWAAQQPEILPLPTSGYEVYLVGEMHGIQENVEFQLRSILFT